MGSIKKSYEAYNILVKTLKESELFAPKEREEIANLITENTKENVSKILLDFFKILKIAFERLYEELKKIQQSSDGQQELVSKKILQDGIKLIFMLRQLITGDPLFLTIGGEFRDKNNNSLQLQTKIYSYKEILENDKIYFDFKEMAFYFEKELYDFTQDVQRISVRKFHNTNFWNDIRKWSYINIRNSNVLRSQSGNVYRKQMTPDENVFLKFAGQNYLYYYYINPLVYPTNINMDSIDFAKEKNFRYFNRGWLLQWYREQEKKQTLVNAFNWAYLKNNKIPLHIFISNSKLDNLPGVRGGDVFNEQLKFKNNQKMLSLNNLIQIIKPSVISKKKNNSAFKGIIPTLEEILSGKTQQSLKEGLKNLYEDYVDLNQTNLNNKITAQVSNLINNLFP